MRLQFLGASHTVTGSCYLAETGSKKFLIDCGMFQGNRQMREKNYEPFMFTPSEIDFVLLTHAHIDHCGLLPRLCAQGFKGKVYATKATCDLVQIMLPDSAHIQESDAEIMNRKGQRTGCVPVEPLYTIEQAQEALQHFVSVPHSEKIDLGEGVSAIFEDAGHILGSAIIELFVEEAGKEPIKIVFSGDLGQYEQPIIKDPTPIKDADYLLVESTYGNRRHEEYDKETELADIINDTCDRGGKLIIPAFAVGRTQKMLYYIYRLWKNKRIEGIPVIIDSPLAIAATRVFAANVQEYDEETLALLEKNGTLPQMPQLKVCETPQQSRALNEQEGPAIILSASGMCDAGRILHHLKHNLWRPEATVLFVGYQAEGCLGRRLLDGIKRVKIMGEEVAVRARIAQMDGFSAHADYVQILQWLDAIQMTGARQVFLVHGEPLAIKALGERIRGKYGYETYAPFYGDVAQLEKESCRIIAADLPQVSVEKEMEEALSVFDSEYRQLRKKMRNAALRDPRTMESILRQGEKGMRYMKRLFKDFGIN